jgi:nucleotide-binding universal stress UspA family protein
MYRRVLLAYDGTVEGRLALREGARIAQICGAEVFLLAVVDLTPAMVSEMASAAIITQQDSQYEAILAEGARRLEVLGFAPQTRLASGDPAQQIGIVAREIGADLVVVGHRHHAAFARWWFGSVASYVIDHAKCSVLVARMEIGDAEFAAIAAPGREEQFWSG